MADYVKMWKDLGMDLESHDMLCQVLPTAVGDVFMTQENRPKAMDFWDLVISEVHGIRPAELIEEQKNGAVIILWSCRSGRRGNSSTRASGSRMFWRKCRNCKVVPV